MTKTDIEPITAAGGVVFRYSLNDPEPMVLMIFRNGVWDLPKGKLEAGESIPMCAVREVAEEVGSSIPTIVRKIDTSYHEYTEGNKLIGKTTYWYSMIFTTPETFTPEKEEGIEAVEWMPVSDAVAKAGYENLKGILKKFTP